jgi:hypothetical protein
VRYDAISFSSNRYSINRNYIINNNIIRESVKVVRIIRAVLMTSKLSFTYNEEQGYHIFKYNGNTLQIKDNQLILNSKRAEVEEVLKNIRKAELR